MGRGKVKTNHEMLINTSDMHTRKRETFWIEAEEFSKSDFAVRGNERTAPVFIMSAALASRGHFVVAFQKPGSFLEYTFREDRNGHWKYRIWMRYATVCPSSRLTVSLNGKPVSSPLVPDSGDYFKIFKWHLLGVVHVPRGSHLLRLTLHTGVIHPDVLFLTPTDAPIESGECERLIQQNQSHGPALLPNESVTSDRLWAQHDRNGVPLGGIGTGKVELCPDGGFANISTNNNQDAPIATAPGSFLLVREQAPDSSPIVRLLEQGRPQAPAVESLTYRGRYPFAELEYSDKALRSRIRLEAFSPMIPYQVADSSVPGAVFNFKLSNPSTIPVKLTVGFSWENLNGCGGLGSKPEFGPGTALRVDGESFFAWNDRAGNDQEPCRTRQGTGLRFYKRLACPYGSSRGEYVVLCSHQDAGLRIGATRSYDVESDLGTLLLRLGQNTGAFPEELLREPGREDGVHPAGVVWAEATLPPGSSQDMVFVLAWHFPVWNDRLGRDGGVHYAHRFGSAGDVADYLLANRERLAAATREVPERVWASSLPDWLKTKVINDQFPLATCTWFDREGNFSVNEAPSMMHGCLGTIDQRTASQGIYTTLFPELDKKELSLFAGFQHANGQFSHDLGHGMIDKERASYNDWPDLACSFVLQAHRYVHATGDLSFGREIAARIPAAVDWVLGMDNDGDGIPDMKPGRGNTYDNNDWPGCSSFVASLWIAALQAASDLARLTGRPKESARYDALSSEAVGSMNRRLWNGSFYRNFDCGDPARAEAEDCLLPQVAGEWALDLMDLPRGLPEDKVASALHEVFTRNIVGKGFKGPADQVTPSGDPALAGTAFLQYAWVYFGALAAYRGMTAEAEACWRQAYVQQWEINRQPWKTRLCGFAMNGKFNGLPWYMTNTSSWYILNAVSGFTYSRPDAWLRVDPHVPVSWNENPGATRLSLPLFGSGFRLGLDYANDAHEIRLKLTPEKVFGTDVPAFQEIRTSIAAGKTIKSLRVNGQPSQEFRLDPGTGRMVISFPAAWVIAEPLEVEMSV